MSDRYTTEDAVALHAMLVNDWHNWGPDTIWDGVKRIDPELLALVVMLHAGAAAQRG